MALKRKLVEGDRKLLAKVFRYNGQSWAYKCLALWYGAISYEEFKKTCGKKWTNQRLAAFKFVHALTNDYTFNAIYNAAEAICPPAIK